MSRLLLAAFVLGLLAASARVAVALARPDPNDLTQGWPVPAPIEQLTRQDWFAYRAHAVFAAGLHLARSAPEAEAVQWLKAAAHARGDAQAEAVRLGVEAARQRSPDRSSFDAELRRIVSSSSEEMRGKVAARVPGFPYVG